MKGSNTAQSEPEKKAYCGAVLTQALKFVEMGIGVLPLKFADKKPEARLLPKDEDGEATWSPLTLKVPSQEQIAEWFGGEEPRNIGVIAGEVSGNLVVLDSDDEPFGVEEMEYLLGRTIEDVSQATLVARTSRGIHTYLRTENVVEHEDFRPLAEFEIRSSGHYACAPPSTHQSGTRYEFLGSSSSILEVSDAWWAEWRQQLDDRLQEWQFVRLLLQEYKLGRRQDLLVGFSGFCRKRLGFPMGRTMRSVELICLVTHDDELEQRLSAVEATYSKPDSEVAVQEWLGDELYEKFRAVRYASKKGNDDTTDDVELSGLPDELIWAENRGRRVVFECRIIGRSERMMTPQRICATCLDCGDLVKVDVIEDFTIFERVIGGENLKRIMVEQLSDSECHHNSVRCRTDEGDHTVLRVEGLQPGNKVRFTTHLVGKKPPTAADVRLQGIVMKNLESGNIEVLATDFEPLKDSLAEFVLSDSDKSTFPMVFARDDSYLFRAPNIKGDERRLAKKIAALADHSVLMIPDIDGLRVVPGYLKVAFVGGTTLGKSEIASSGSSHDATVAPYFYSVYLNAEMASRTGLGYAIDVEHRLIEWGELVINDSKEVVLDGLDRFGPEELAQFREVLRSGKIRVSRVVKGETDARCRLIATLNPGKPGGLKDYAFPAEALTDLPCFPSTGGGRAGLIRFDLFVPFQPDVPPAVLASEKTITRPMAPEIYFRHVLWAWTRKPTDIIYTSEGMEAIRNYTVTLLGEYESTNIPIINNSVMELMMKLSVATACLAHHTDESQEKVIVDRHMVKRAYDTLIEVLGAWSLKDYIKMVERPMHEFEANEFVIILKELTSYDYDILQELLKGRRTATEVSEAIHYESQTVRLRFGVLKAHGLIAVKSGSHAGASLTPKGAKFCRRVFLEEAESPPAVDEPSTGGAGRSSPVDRPSTAGEKETSLEDFDILLEEVAQTSSNHDKLKTQGR